MEYLIINFSSVIAWSLTTEKYKTEYIRDGVLQYLIDKLSIQEKDVKQFLKALSYSDGSSFDMSGDAERIVSKILADELRYNGNKLSYPMKCMVLGWRVRNFSAHNLSGISHLLTNAYASILSVLFSALFFASEVL